MARFCVAILGAQCTGKTTLAKALVARMLADQTPASGVPDYWPQWCTTRGRTPWASEQHHISMEQARRIASASTQAQKTGVVIADSAPLMTAVYSEVYFNDISLYPFALEHHRSYRLTLVSGLDLVGVADGVGREEEAMRGAVNGRLREVLASNGIAFSAVYGQGQARTDCALQAITFVAASASASPHVFASADQRTATRQRDTSAWTWSCEKCSDADCEHQLFSRLTK